MSHFYSYLIEYENLIIKLDDLDLTGSHKLHLSQLIDSTIHQEILDLVLSNLSIEDKIQFLKLLKNDPKDKKIMELLKNKIEGIENQIKSTALKIHTELHSDIEEAKKVEK